MSVKNCGKGVITSDEPCWKKYGYLVVKLHRKKKFQLKISFGWYFFLWSTVFLATKLCCRIFFTQFIFRPSKKIVQTKLDGQIFRGIITQKSLHDQLWLYFDCDLCWPMIGLEKLHREGGQDISTLQLLDWKVDSVKSVEELLKKIWIMLYIIQT